MSKQRIMHWVNCGWCILASSFKQCLILLVIAVLSPFGIVQSTDDRNHAMWEQFRGVSHWPAADANANGTGDFDPAVEKQQETRERYRAQHPVTVFTIDAKTVKSTGMSKPMSLLDLQDAIKQLTERQGPTVGGPSLLRPVAVFVDLDLGDRNIGVDHAIDPLHKETDAAGLIPGSEHPELDKQCNDLTQVSDRSPDAIQWRCFLNAVGQATHFDGWRANRNCQESTAAKIACIVAYHGIPILFADPDAPRTNLDGYSLEESAQISTIRALDFVAGTVPVVVNTQSYQMVTPVKPRRVANEAYSLYPASALYWAWCVSGRSSQLARPAKCPDQLPSRIGLEPRILADRTIDPRVAWPTELSQPLDVVWGIGNPEAFADLARLHGPQAERCGSFSSGLLSRWTISLIFSGLRFLRPNAEPCPSSYSLPLEDLQNPLATDDNLRNWLDGKLVLLGGAFPYSGDWVPSPAFGQVPGVFYHAMALDNLLEDGEAYRQADQPVVSPFAISRNDLKALLPITIVAFLLGVARVTFNWTRLDPEKAGSASQAWLGRVALLVVTWAILVVLAKWVGGGGLIPSAFTWVAFSLFCLAGAIEALFWALEPLLAGVARTLRLRSLSKIKWEQPDGAPSASVKPEEAG